MLSRFNKEQQLVSITEHAAVSLVQPIRKGSSEEEAPEGRLKPDEPGVLSFGCRHEFHPHQSHQLTSAC